MFLQNIKEQVWLYENWHIWKFLKFGKTDLGWDPTTRKFSGSKKWWDKKIKDGLLHILL